jgi:cellobiose-specific phosphotransferase system component IIC
MFELISSLDFFDAFMILGGAGAFFGRIMEIYYEYKESENKE